MRVLLQRVKYARVSEADHILGAIDQGLLLLIGIERDDSATVLEKMVNKVLAYRVFSDKEGKMNLSVQDINGGVMAVSQFTLAADTQKGLRPGFSQAAPPQEAEQLYNMFVKMLREKHAKIATGRFAADMQVELVNDGPVTFLLDMQ